MNLRDTRWKNAARVEQLTTTIADASQRGDSATIRVLLEDRSRLLKAMTQLERRISDINNEFSARIQATLTLPYSERFRVAYDARAYPRLFPDQGDPSDLLTQLANVAELDAEALVAIRSIFETYRTSRDEVNRRLRTAQDEADEAFASALTSAGRDTAAATTAELLEKRREVHRTVLAQVAAVLPILARRVVEWRKAMGQPAIDL